MGTSCSRTRGTGREMNTSERIILAVIVLAVGVLVAIPPIYGWMICPPDRHYLGLFGEYGRTQACYLAWGPRQAQEGHWLFEDKFNGAVDRRLVFNPLWLAMGWIARLTGWSVLIIFHIERVLFSMILVLVVHRIVRRFVAQPGWRLFAVALAVFGSGFGFLVAHRSVTPDLWVSESNLFLIMLWEAVLPAAAVLFLLAIHRGYRTFFEHGRHAVATGLLTLLLGSVWPYGVVSVYAILGVAAAYTAVTRRDLRGAVSRYATIVLISAAVVIYDGYLVMSEPSLGEHRAPLSPGLDEYFVGFGVVSVLALVGAFYAFRERNRRLAFVLIWLVTTFCVIYLPVRMVAFQLCLILGVQVPLVILAVYAARKTVGDLLTAGRPVRRRLTLAGLGCLLAFSAGTSIYHYRNTLAAMHRFEPPEYLDVANYEAMRWLAEHSRDDEVVLSSPTIALYIPVISHNRMYALNMATMTAGYHSKIARLRGAFADDRDGNAAVLRRFLHKHEIAYVYVERRLIRRLGPAVHDRLHRFPGATLVFHRGDVTIFRISPPPPSAA